MSCFVFSHKFSQVLSMQKHLTGHIALSLDQSVRRHSEKLACLVGVVTNGH